MRSLTAFVPGAIFVAGGGSGKVRLELDHVKCDYSATARFVLAGCSHGAIASTRLDVTHVKLRATNTSLATLAVPLWYYE